MSNPNTANRPEGVRSRRRRQYIIHPSFQWKIAGWLMADVFVVCAFMGVVMYGVQERFARARALNPGAAELGDVMFVVTAFALVFAAASAVALGIFSIMMTHRICGPLQVMQNGLSEIAAGRLPKVRPLRKRDEFKQFHDTYASAVEALQTRRRQEITAMNAVIELARSSIDADEQTKAGALEMIVKHVDNMRKTAATSLGHTVTQTQTTSTTETPTSKTNQTTESEQQTTTAERA